MRVIIKRSTRTTKKMMAIFYDEHGKRRKTTHFGQAGADDYTITKDKKQRARYINRHTNAREDHSKFMTAGSLSRHILWGEFTSMKRNIAAYKSRFGLT